MLNPYALGATALLCPLMTQLYVKYTETYADLPAAIFTGAALATQIVVKMVVLPF